MILFFLGIGWAAAGVGLLLFAHARYDHKSEMVRYGIGIGVVLGCLVGWAWCAEAVGEALTAARLTLAALGVTMPGGLAVIAVHEEDKARLRDETRERGYPPLDQEP